MECLRQTLTKEQMLNILSDYNAEVMRYIRLVIDTDTYHQATPISEELLVKIIDNNII